MSSAATACTLLRRCEQAALNCNWRNLHNSDVRASRCLISHSNTGHSHIRHSQAWQRSLHR